MHELYEQADILLLTSAFEGLPVVIMQMMAYGKVVVSTAVSGIPDYIHHEQNGILLFSTDEQAIVDEGVEKLEFLLKNPALRMQLGDQAKKDAMATFGRQNFEKKYLEILGFDSKSWSGNTTSPYLSFHLNLLNFWNFLNLFQTFNSLSLPQIFQAYVSFSQ